MTELFLFALNITGPILFLLVLGWALKRRGLIEDAFITTGNRIVYNITLPAMLFFSTASVPFRQSFDWRVTVFGLVTTPVLVLLLWLIAPRLVLPEQRGVFVQGAFRGNMGIIGIGLILNAYGEAILPKAGFYLAVLTILYNFLSVWVLRPTRRSFVRVSLKNPLIIAVLLGFACSAAGIAIPEIVSRTGGYLSRMTLPLALLCVGASLRWSSFRLNHRGVIWASVFKLVFIPAMLMPVAIWAGFRGAELGLLFLMMSAPSAAASYVMAEQMAGQGAMAAEIIALTTSACAFTITPGLVLLKVTGHL